MISLAPLSLFMAVKSLMAVTGVIMIRLCDRPTFGNLQVFRLADKLNGYCDFSSRSD